MPYDSAQPIDRFVLAHEIVRTLTNAGFIEEWHGDENGRDRDPGDITKERTFYRAVEDVQNVRIVVYTTIEGDRVREAGKDSIRVVAVYRQKTGSDKGISRETRVHRTGEVEGIVERMMTRARATWSAVRRIPCCPRCGAPTFKSKKGNQVCADLCWTVPTRSNLT